jgi:hypothetical protein
MQVYVKQIWELLVFGGGSRAFMPRIQRGFFAADGETWR